MLYFLSMRKKAQIDKQMFFDFYGVSLLSDQYLEANPYAKEYKDTVVQEVKDVYVPLITKMVYGELWFAKANLGDWEEWKKSFNIEKVEDLTLEQLVQIYREGDWESAFGGPAWGEITKSLIELEENTDTNQLITIIDHINDIQHNTGLMFHDFPKVEKWFSDALEIKSKATAQQLIPYLSSDVKDFVIEDLRLRGEEIVAKEPVRYLTFSEKFNLAGSSFTSPKILDQLAKDPNKDVRRMVADNTNTSIKTLIELSKDKDKNTAYRVYFNLNTPEEVRNEIKRTFPSLFSNEVLNMRKKSYIVYDDKGRKFEVSS